MLEDLSAWVISQRARLGGAGKKPASYNALAGDILVRAGHDITGEALRAWELKSLKKNPSPAKLQLVVDYAHATTQPRPGWIPEAASNLTLAQIIEWQDAAPLHLVALIVSRGIEILAKSNYRQSLSPQFAEMHVHMQDRQLCKMIHASGKSIEEIAAGASISESRLRQIIDGATDAQLGELALLASALVPNGDVDAIVAAYEANS